MRFRLLPVLALLAACRTSGITPPKATAADSTAPDQIMHGMVTYLVRNGVQTSKVEADTAYINQQTHYADLTGVRLTFFDSTTGRSISTITSATGRYDMQNQSLDARGNVVAVTNTGKTLKTEHLVYDKIQNRIHSDTAFTVTGSTEHMSGTAFETDPDFKVVTVTHPRGGEIVPPAKAKRGTAKSGRGR